MIQSSHKHGSTEMQGKIDVRYNRENGMIEVTDKVASWVARYRRDGTYHSGAVDCPTYQRAATMIRQAMDMNG